MSIYDDLHHLFLRRNPDHPLLYCELNMALVCHNCHVPEAPGLNLKAAVQKWGMGFSPDDVRMWLASLPFKVTPGLPSWFVDAESIYDGR